MIIALVVTSLGVAPARSLELTGVLLQGLGPDGTPLGVVWHTASEQGGRPLGVTRAAPSQLHTFPLGNDPNGEIDKWLTPGVHIATLFWQCRAGEYPAAMVMNLYFNSDNLTPGISVVIPNARGLTQYQVNSAPTTLSLYLREVDNIAGLFFDDGTLRARIGAAFYVPSWGVTNGWRPSDLVNIDHVGPDAFRPDGQKDGVLVFELTVVPSPPSVPRRSGGGPVRPPPSQASGPVGARLSGDKWVVPPTPTLAAVPPTRGAAPVQRQPTPMTTPSVTVQDEATLEVTPGVQETGTTTVSARPTTPVTTRTRTGVPPGTATPARTTTPGRTATPERTQARRPAPPRMTPTQAGTPAPPGPH